MSNLPIIHQTVREKRVYQKAYKQYLALYRKQPSHHFDYLFKLKRKYEPLMEQMAKEIAYIIAEECKKL